MSGPSPATLLGNMLAGLNADLTFLNGRGEGVVASVVVGGCRYRIQIDEFRKTGLASDPWAGRHTDGEASTIKDRRAVLSLLRPAYSGPPGNSSPGLTAPAGRP